MRRSSLVTALVAVSAGLTAAAAVRGFVRRRRSALAAALPAARPAGLPVLPAVVAAPAQAPQPRRDAVVLPFIPRVAVEPVADRPAAPTRCGDTGGRTKAGAPCAARATSGGRCHHHPKVA